MPPIDGLHGTTSIRAMNIQKDGFSLPSTEEHRTMFGNAVYMYFNDDQGLQYAYSWANFLIKKHSLAEVPVVLNVKFFCKDEEYIEWTLEKELDFARWIKNNKISSRVEQNRLRLLLISRSARTMEKDCKVISSYMPAPPKEYKLWKIRYKAYAVKDLSLLPSPPYPLI